MMNIAGAMIAQEMVNAVQSLGKVLVANAVHHVQMFASMGVEEAQTVLGKVRLGCFSEGQRSGQEEG